MGAGPPSLGVVFPGGLLSVKFIFKVGRNYEEQRRHLDAECWRAGRREPLTRLHQKSPHCFPKSRFLQIPDSLCGRLSVRVLGSLFLPGQGSGPCISTSPQDPASGTLTKSQRELRGGRVRRKDFSLPSLKLPSKTKAQCASRAFVGRS